MLTSVTQSCQELQQLIDDFRVIEGQKGPATGMDERMDIGGFGGGMGRMGMGMGMGRMHMM